MAKQTNPRITSPRLQTCIVCEAPVIVESVTTCDSGAPEMLRLPPATWIGFIQGDHAPEFIVVCSTTCLAKLLSR